MKNKHALVILGPTGVGKTETAIRIAEKLETEIISADSRQVYKQLRIGTAVPTPEQLGRVRHRLLQHRSIWDDYSASIFEKEGMEILEWLFEKNDFVVISGGSGLYIKALLYGIDDFPDVDPGIREELARRLEEEGLESLRFELKKLDPESYDCLDLRNPSRILKALEVCLTTGKPYSSFLTGNGKDRDYNTIKIGLNMDRNELYSRINHRVDDMMNQGLLEEARAVHPYKNKNALNTVGYKELFDYFEGQTSLDEAIYLIKRNSRRYARRQLTWFNQDEEITWFNPDQFNEIMDHIHKHAGAGD